MNNIFSTPNPEIPPSNKEGNLGGVETPQEVEQELTNLENANEQEVLLATIWFATQIWAFFRKIFGKEKKEALQFSEKVGNAIFDKFKLTLLEKKDQNGNQFYSAQLLGTLDFLGEPFLSSLFELKNKDTFWDSALVKAKTIWVVESLKNAGVPQQEIDAFLETLEAYLNVAPTITTEDDLKNLTEENAPALVGYKHSVDTQLEEQLTTRIQREQQEFIEQREREQQENWITPPVQVSSPARSEHTESLQTNTPAKVENVPQFREGYIGSLPKSFPVKSAPFERSESWCTLCARTAWKNGQTFGVNLQRGNAYDAARMSPISSSFQKKIGSVDKKEYLHSDFSALSPGSNFADIYTTSSSKYGHRAVAFLNQRDGKRYVLDPYPKWMGRSTQPVTLDDYQKKTNRKILQANFYKSEYYVV